MFLFIHDKIKLNNQGEYKMKQRSPTTVFLLGLVTGGIYSWYWAVKTKGEMNNLGEKIPTAWVWLIPVVGTIWWYWKYAEGVEHVTNEKTSGVLAFVLLFLLGFIGQAIIQDSFNKIVAVAPTAPAQPSYVQPVVDGSSASTMTPPPTPPTTPNGPTVI